VQQHALAGSDDFANILLNITPEGKAEKSADAGRGGVAKNTA
jgi:hypothetical protein